jgi:hypothetical protein
LILGSISVASAASGKVKLTDVADNANQDAIQVTYDLGIVTGTPEGAYEPEKAVNRAEFAALITRALAIPESALSYYSTTTFKDTSGYGWAVPYLAVLQQRGIMKGDGYGNAMPGRTISPNEAVTMVLRAIGYTDNASVLVGQWPANYVALGQSLNLYAKVASDLQMNKASAAQMVYNVLTTQLVQVDANSTVKYLYDADSNNVEQSLLTTSLNCSRDPDTGKKVISYADASSSKINLVPQVGAYGVLYRSNVDREVVALTKVETEFIAGRLMYRINATGAVVADVFQSVDGTKYNLSDAAQVWADRLNSKGANYVWNGTAYVPPGASEELLDTIVTTGQAVFLNGDAINTLTGSQSNKYIYFSPTRENQAARLIIAARVSGVTILDLRSVAIWDTEFRGDNFLYESGQIDSKKFNGHEFPLDVSNEVDDYGYVLAGIDSLDDLATDNVIYIYKNGKNRIARIDVGTKTQSGAITNINAADSVRTIGGTVLVDSPYHHSATWSDLGTINNEGTALLDIYGRTYAFLLGEASKGNFAIVVDADFVALGGMQAKLFDKTAKEVIYSASRSATAFVGNHRYDANGVWNFPLATPAPVTPDVTTHAEAGYEYIGDAYSTAGDPTLNVGGREPLVEYKLSGGKLGEIRVGTFIANTPADKFGHVNKAGTIITIRGTNYLIDSSALVYVVNNGDYSLGSVNDLVDKDLVRNFWYILGADGKVKALRVESDDAGAQNLFVLINSVTRGTDNAGGEIDVVNGVSFADGTQAAGKTWDYTDMGLRGRFGTERYAVPVKFRVGEDNILKAAVPLWDFSVYDTNSNNVIDSAEAQNPTITGAAISVRTPGSGGTFTLTLRAGSWYDDGVHAVNPTAWSNLVAFEADTVLYKLVAGSWTAMAPTEGNFNADEGRGVYALFKTDTKKAYDIIIKIN